MDLNLQSNGDITGVKIPSFLSINWLKLGGAREGRRVVEKGGMRDSNERKCDDKSGCSK